MNGFSCPSDPSYGNGAGNVGPWAYGSYSANYQVFGNPGAGDNGGNMMGSPNLKNSFSDGTSQTILFAEQYAQRPFSRYKLWAHGGWNPSWMPIFAYGKDNGNGTYQNYSSGMDSGTGSVGPNSKFLTVSAPIFAASTNPTDIQAPIGIHAGGMVVGLADGSVRLLNTGVSAATWWAACTPAGGEVLDSSW
jgi:hypothetical protein